MGPARFQCATQLVLNNTDYIQVLDLQYFLDQNCRRSVILLAKHEYFLEENHK